MRREAGRDGTPRFDPLAGHAMQATNGNDDGNDSNQTTVDVDINHATTLEWWIEWDAALDSAEPDGPLTNAYDALREAIRDVDGDGTATIPRKHANTIRQWVRDDPAMDSADDGSLIQESYDALANSIDDLEMGAGDETSAGDVAREIVDSCANAEVADESTDAFAIKFSKHYMPTAAFNIARDHGFHVMSGFGQTIHFDRDETGEVDGDV